MSTSMPIAIMTMTLNAAIQPRKLSFRDNALWIIKPRLDFYYTMPLGTP
jgi:hypothetical protein